MHCFKIILIDPRLYWLWPLIKEPCVFGALCHFFCDLFWHRAVTTVSLFYLNLQQLIWATWRQWKQVVNKLSQFNFTCWETCLFLHPAVTDKSYQSFGVMFLAT